MTDADIIAYYQHGLERGRLAGGRSRVEFLRVWDLLERWLPAAPARVLDAGGRAGVYAGLDLRQLGGADGSKMIALTCG